MQACNMGWRQAASIDDHSYPSPTDDKTALFEAARLCVRALRLPSNSRFILDQLCASYGGELVEGRVIVWPSNRYLEERTGIPERTIRFTLNKLIGEGVIAAKDSPNGKRYARRDRNGAVTLAYGFDLTPLLHRLSEFRDQVLLLEEHERDRLKAFDALTITRRNAQELLTRLLVEFPEADSDDLARRAETLSQALPRRSSKVIPMDALRLWRALLDDLQTAVLAASAGDSCRHKDTNKNPHKISCSKGIEQVEAKPVRRALPDAVQLLGDFGSDEEMFAQAERYRGMLGVSHDAWIEARRVLGDDRAARLVYLVTQIQARPSPGAQQIRNFGGYFRVLMRKIAEGAVDLDAEIRRRKS